MARSIALLNYFCKTVPSPHIIKPKELHFSDILFLLNSSITVLNTVFFTFCWQDQLLTFPNYCVTFMLCVSVLVNQYLDAWGSFMIQWGKNTPYFFKRDKIKISNTFYSIPLDTRRSQLWRWFIRKCWWVGRLMSIQCASFRYFDEHMRVTGKLFYRHLIIFTLALLMSYQSHNKMIYPLLYSISLRTVWHWSSPYRQSTPPPCQYHLHQISTHHCQC